MPDVVVQVEGRRPAKSDADGAYDKWRWYEAPGGRGIALILPRREAGLWPQGNRAGAPWQREENWRAIRCTGRQRWEEESGYHRRRVAETTVYCSAQARAAAEERAESFSTKQ